MSRQAKIREIANKIGTKPEWLDALINFETAGTYSTDIKNPYSSARGLIQITDAAARDIFGASGSKELVELYNTFDAQMDNVVLPYLQHRQRYFNSGLPFNTMQSLFMAVFYPAYINKPINTEFPDSVKNVNPGINTVRDYIDKASRRINPDTLSFPADKVFKISGLLLLVGIGLFLYFRS